MEKQEKYGFVYIWYDKLKKMYYIGSHWGTENDGYICSSRWMRDSYRRRKHDFRRKTIIKIFSSRENLLKEEQYWLNMIKDEELATKNSTDNTRKKNVRYYNISKTAQQTWHYNDEKRKTIGEKVSIAKTGKSLGPCSPEKAENISKAKKAKFVERGGMSEEHKAALRKQKSTGAHSNERKEQISQNSKEFWNSPEGTALKEKRKIEGNSEESKLRLSQTLKEKGHKPTKEAIQQSIKKCSKTYKVISPTGEEMTITNLKAFCREKDLTDINMVRSSGSKGWKAYLI